MSANDNDKNELDKSALLTSRARNRTVMLSSDMTGQVRSLIQSAEVQDTEEATGSHGFMAPVNFNKTELPSEEANKSSFGDRNQTELIDSNLKESLSSTPIDSIGFSSLKREVDSYDRTIPASVKEILNTKEYSKGRHRASDTSTLVNHAQTSFDVDRGNLEKVRKGFRKSKILGFLISFDRDEFGEIVEIREGRSIISSKYVDQSDMLFIDDDSLSSPHAVIKADRQGNILLLDQLSETGSSVIRPGSEEEIDAVGNLVELRQGDIVRLGSRYFIFCAVPKIAIQD